MSAHIDPIDAIFSGFATPVKIWFLTYLILILAALTAGAAVAKEEFLGTLVLRLSIVVPLFTWFFAGGHGIVGILALVGVILIAFYAMIDRISPRNYVYGIYASSFLFFSLEVARADRWWLAVCIFATVTLYYWYVYPLMIRQRERNAARNG